MTAQFDPIGADGAGYRGTCCGSNTDFGSANAASAAGFVVEPAGAVPITGTVIGAPTLARRGRYLRLGSCSVTSKVVGVAGHVAEGMNCVVSALMPGPSKITYTPLRFGFRFHCGEVTGTGLATDVPVIASMQTNAPSTRRSTSSFMRCLRPGS